MILSCLEWDKLAFLHRHNRIYLLADTKLKMCALHICRIFQCGLHSPTAPTPSQGKKNLPMSLAQIWMYFSRTVNERTPAIWSILCESCSRRRVPEDLPQFDKEGRSWKRRGKRKSKWQLPPFHQTLSHTQAHSVHTHSHNDTPSIACALWFIHSCYLHFTLLTGHSLFDHGGQLSQGNWCSHINWKTSKVFKENRSFSGRDPFLPRGQLSELRSYDDSLRQKPGNRSQRKQANRRK